MTKNNITHDEARQFVLMQERYDKNWHIQNGEVILGMNKYINQQEQHYVNLKELNNMTKETFDLKYRGEKVAVHCDTEEKAKAFLGLAKSMGYKWVSDRDLSYTSNFVDFQGNTYYTIELSLNGKEFGISYGNIKNLPKSYIIVEFTLDEPNGYAIEDTPSPTKETFNVGDVVYAVRTGLEMKVISRPYLLESKDGSRWYMVEELLTHKKPLKEITKKELAELGFVLKK